MGSFLTRLTEDVKAAMRAKDQHRLDVLRMLVSGIKYEQDRQAADSIPDEDELAVLMRAVKTRRDSVAQALEVGRQEIADKESSEIVIVEEYLPSQMTGDELAAKVAEVAASIDYGGPKDTGKFMKEWMAKYKGQADGREVQTALKGLASN